MTKSIIYYALLGVLSLIRYSAGAQVEPANTYKLSLAEAVRLAKSENKWVQAAGAEESAAEEDRKDVTQAALPTINLSGSYQRYSDLTLFSRGLSHSATIPLPPTANAAALGFDASISIYGGGRQRALQQEKSSRLKLAALHTQDESGNIALETASQYLELVKLTGLQKLVQDQLKRAQKRLITIKSLYNNQKVTRSDVLRAQVALSNVQLSVEQNENDITIAGQKIDILINVPDSVKITPADSAAMPKPAVSSLLSIVQGAGLTSFEVQKAGEDTEIQRALLKNIESNNKPSLSLYAAYGLNYPNYLQFPPVNQSYALGFVGLKAQYSISSLYHNKSKIAAARFRVKALSIQQDAYRDHLRTGISSDYIKYGEALHSISVNERSVEQAAVNYRIVNTKYLNQLSLLTDLLDADNLYQESRYDLVKAQTDALAIYYHMLYISGNL